MAATDTILTEHLAQGQACSKCGNGLDTEGYPLWCLKCRAKYKREYESLKDQRGEARGFAKGVEAMRRVLANEFDRIGSAGFTGYECASLIAQVPAPRHDATA